MSLIQYWKRFLILTDIASVLRVVYNCSFYPVVAVIKDCSQSKQVMTGSQENGQQSS